MKTRQGFVSNSSSSSFIVAAKNSKVKIEIEIDLESFCREENVISTLEAVDERFYDIAKDYRCDSKQELFKIYPKQKQDYDKCVEAITKGMKIYFGSASSESGDAVETYLCDNGFNDITTTKDIVIIQGEGGY